MRRSLRTAVTVVALLAVVGTLAVGPAAAQSADSNSTAADGETERCFPPGGHELGVGTEGPGIAMTIHTSLFSNLGGEGALGMEARGTALNETVVSLRTGVVFDGVGDAGAFLSNPFDAFAIVFDYSFELPMFSSLGEDRSSYEADGSPVSGVETRAC